METDQDLHQEVVEWVEEVDHDQDQVGEDLKVMEVVIDKGMEEEEDMVKWIVPEMMTEEEEWECKETSVAELHQKILVVVVTINLKT